LRALGIALLILSAIRIPLPQADYHNVRHHDAPGEICPYHDHLLRWHPTADRAEDVALLHWHWFLPLVQPGAAPGGSDDEQRTPGSGPALHAHLGDWAEPDWRSDPVIRPDSRGRFLEQLALGHIGAGSGSISVPLAVDDPGTPSFPANFSTEPLGLRAPRIALFQRWNC
jgi:hypothetical protein